MCAEGITLFDRSRKARADNGSADSRIGGSPLERIGLDAMLVWVGCCEMSSVPCHAIMQLGQRQGSYVSLRK